MNKCSFLIVCFVTFLASCKAPQQLVFEKTEISPVQQIEFPVTITVPPTESDTVIDMPEGFLDGVFLELENAYVELQELRLENKRLFSVKVTTKERFVTDTVTLEYQTILKTSCDVDSVFVVAAGDTCLSQVLQKSCPTLPATTQPGRFPFIEAITFLALLLMWWAGKKKPKPEKL